MATPALADVFVLDFSKFLPGPYCTWMLAELGAEVVRIEHPRELAKQAQVFGVQNLTADQQRSRRARDVFARNKKSVLLDPGDAASRPLLEALVRRADVLIEDYRPGVMDKMDLGYSALSAINPRLIYCSVTLCGQTGPYREKPGHDPIALSISGALSRCGENPAAPSFPGLPVADLITGSNAAIGVLSRNADLAALPQRGRRRADAGLWRCADGRFVCTTDMEPRYWAKFCETVGRPDFIALQLNVDRWDEMRRDLDAIFATRTSAEWMTAFDSAGTQAALVYEPAEALEDAHNQARGMAPVYPGPDGAPIRQIGCPIKLSDSPAAFRHLAHMPGEDEMGIRAELGVNDPN
jgi:crotonobetainyl-CoA:carnitine CoA-transferase CaiB-like acyl-CoA transferase